VLAAETDAYLPVTSCFDEPWRLVSTGGTTGKSKGVLHSHVGTLFTVLADIAEYGIRRNWQTLSVLPAYHVAGMEWGLFTILWRGGTVVFPATTSFDPVGYLAEIRARNIEYLPLVPALINPIYDAWDGRPIDSPRTVVTTAAPTPAPLRRKLAEMFPKADILAAAGLSESLNMATQSPGELLSHPDSIGAPHIDTRVLIVDDDDRAVTRGQPGHIAMRNFNMALGYHDNPAASAATWRPRRHDPEGLHWCFTGDIGVMDEDGRISIVDGSKDVILTGGESVPSVEVETVYAEHPGISDCAAVGVEDPRWGEAILLVAVKMPPDTEPNTDDQVLADDLFRFGRDRLAGFKVPRKIAFIDALPRSHFGKVLKRDLREQLFERIFDRSHAESR
jgi:fatty-acyl-CoA synthase